jgi:hypothetical protein
VGTVAAVPAGQQRSLRPVAESPSRGDGEGLDVKATYQAISDAAAKASATTGRPLTLSICNWGKQNPWNWGAGMAVWRTNTDIIFHGQTPSWDSMLANFDANVHPSAQHTGYYNDRSPRSWPATTSPR